MKSYPSTVYERRALAALGASPAHAARGVVARANVAAPDAARRFRALRLLHAQRGEPQTTKQYLADLRWRMTPRWLRLVTGSIMTMGVATAAFGYLLRKGNK